MSDEEISRTLETEKYLRRYYDAVVAKDYAKQIAADRAFKEHYRELQYNLMDQDYLRDLEPAEKLELDMEIDADAEDILNSYLMQLDDLERLFDEIASDDSDLLDDFII